VFDVLDIVGVVLTTDQIIDSFALFVDRKSGFVEFINGIVLFVIYYRMQDTFIGEIIQTLLFITFKELLLRGCQVYLALKLIIFLVLFVGMLLLLLLMNLKS